MQKQAASLKVEKKSTYLWVLFAVCLLTLTVPPAGSLATRSHESDDQNPLIWQGPGMPVQRSAPLAERPSFELLRSSLRQRSRLEATVSLSGFHGSSPGRSLRATQQQALPTSSMLAMAGLTPHGPIVILSDSDFAAQGWPGSGTSGDPYRIEHLAIDLNSTDGNCIEIQSTSAHFVVFNCTLTEATGLGYSGIYLNDVQNGRLEANNITGNDIGILLRNSNLNNILNNAISNHSRAGVYLDGSSDNTIRTNNVSTSWSGLYLEWSTSNVLNNNYCYDNEFGIDVYGASTSNSIVNNTCVSNNYGIYLLHITENAIIENNCSQNNVGIHVLESNSNSIDTNICNENVYGGILVNLSVYNDVSDNYCGYNTNWAGIILSASNHTRVTDNTCTGNPDGIWLTASSQNELLHNNCTYNVNGIHIQDSSGDQIANNICNNNTDTGMLIEGVSLSLRVVYNNTCSDNGIIGIVLMLGANATELSQNVCSSNVVSSQAGILLMESYNNTVDSNACYGNQDFGIQMLQSELTIVKRNNITVTGGVGIFLEESVNNTLAGNICHDIFNPDWDSGYAIYLMYLSDFNLIEDNLCYDNPFGILLFQANNNTVINNFCFNSTHVPDVSSGIAIVMAWNNTVTNNRLHNNTVGAFLLDTNGNTISFNSLRGNEFGVYLEDDSANNTISWNVFENNTANGWDAGTTNIIDYNFWSNYTGSDANGDGFGDVPHPIQGDAGNADPHPLMFHPFPPEWVQPPTDQVIEFGAHFEYELEVTSTAPFELWVNDSAAFAIDVNETIVSPSVLPVGVYPLEVRAINIYGYAAKGVFTLLVQDTTPPTVNSPDDITYTSGEPGALIEWSISDLSYLSYRVLRNGTEVDSSGITLTAYQVTISVEYLDPGVHNFTIVAVDAEGNIATDTVLVTVLPIPFLEAMLPFLILGLAGVAVVVVILVLLRKRKLRGGENS